MRSLLRPSHRLEAVRPECQRRSESGEDLDQLRCLSARQVCWQPLHWPGGPSGRAALPLKVPLQLAAPQGQIHHVQLLQPLIKLLRRSLLEELRFFFPKEWGGGASSYFTPQLQSKRRPPVQAPVQCVCLPDEIQTNMKRISRNPCLIHVSSFSS